MQKIWNLFFLTINLLINLINSTEENNYTLNSFSKYNINNFNINNNNTNNNYNQITENIKDKKNIVNYNFYNLVQNVKYSLQPISPNSPYKSNNTCVTIEDQIKYNYTIDFYSYEYRGKIFPENFCYGLLTYNISRNDFSDIIRKNISKFLYKKNI